MKSAVYRSSLYALPLGALLAIILFLGPHAALSQAAGTAATGYHWSDTIGWIDGNCANSNTCGSQNFGFSIAPDGTLSGYAWSDNIGWVSAESSDLSGCPSSPCIARVQPGGAVTGWLKATAADNNGWDGWISLSGPGYGVTESAGAFSGYAWGSDVVGWLDMNGARALQGPVPGPTPEGACTPAYSCSGNTIQYTNASCQVSNLMTCVDPEFCSPGSATCLYPAIPAPSIIDHLQVHPAILNVGTQTTVTWKVANVSSCAVSGTNGDSWSASSGSQTSSPINQQTTYTLSCTGLDGSHVRESAVVNLVPNFQEL